VLNLPLQCVLSRLKWTRLVRSSSFNDEASRLVAPGFDSHSCPAKALHARVAVHCGAGLGRSGTPIAAYLVSQGAAPDDAIALVRARRPGSIETAEQEVAVHEFARRLNPL
jgi:protein tyrosine phosphatase